MLFCVAITLALAGCSAQKDASEQGATAGLAATYSAGEAARPQAVSTITAHDGAVTAIAFTPDGEQLVSIGYDDRSLRLWDSRTGRQLDAAACEDRPNDLALRPDGSAAYIVDAKGRVTEWPIGAGALGEGKVFAGRAGRTPRIAVDASGHRAVTTSWDDPVKLWDLDARTYVSTLPESDRMRGVAFSPTAPVVAAGNHTDYFAVWDLDKPAKPERKAYKVPKVASQSDISAVAYSPDGHWLVTGHMDSSISLWDMKKGKQKFNWYVRDASTMDVTFSPCGTVLATAQQNGKVYLWETSSKNLLFWLSAHQGAATSVAFNPADETILATGGEDGAIVIWN